MNKTSLAKAIAIVMGFILGSIVLTILIGNYPLIGILTLFGIMGLIAIALLYQIVMLVYEQIEYNKQYKN